MSSGGVGFSVGSQSLKVTDTATDTTQKGSTVGVFTVMFPFRQVTG